MVCQLASDAPLRMVPRRVNRVLQAKAASTRISGSHSRKISGKTFVGLFYHRNWLAFGHYKDIVVMFRDGCPQAAFYAAFVLDWSQLLWPLGPQMSPHSLIIPHISLASLCNTDLCSARNISLCSARSLGPTTCLYRRPPDPWRHTPFVYCTQARNQLL